MKKSVRAAATAVLSIGLIGFGAASDVQAQAFPNLPCNPGDNWNPGGGPYCNGPGPGPGWGPGGDFGPGDGGGGPGNIGGGGPGGGGGDGGGGHGGGGGGGGGH